MPIVNGLTRAAAYPHPVEAIAVRETHISWVFLTGRWAYKVKKPVATSFLDFSALELRRAACLEELRLNQRFARELYVDVVPISGSEDEPVVMGKGAAIEHAVRMRQFNEEGLLSHMAAAGALTADHVDQLAECIASFHAGAEHAPRESSWGSPQAVWAEADENFGFLTTDPPPAARRDIQEIRRWTQSQWRRLQQSFVTRKASGCVRECHGDLHLGNVVWLPPNSPGAEAAAGSPVLFDCIEFNPAFRWIDVLSDVTFTVMDLADRGLPELANRLLNSYLEHTGDYCGAPVLRWYLVYRAMVRAKVAAIRSGQNAGRDRTQALEEVVDYVELAAAYIRPRAPRLLITSGPSGSGKSTGVMPLVSAGAIRIRSDVERRRLFDQPGAPKAEGVGTGMYSPDATRRTYDRLAVCARAVIEGGYTAIVDATFLKREERERFRRLSGELSVPFGIVPFDAPVEELQRRIVRRRAQDRDASQATVQVLEQQLATREPLADDEQCFRRTVEQLLADAE